MGLLAPALAIAQPLPSVAAAPDGSLTYTANARGDHVVDFSHAGFEGGGRPLPVVRAAIVVAPADGDDGERIQAGIDAVSRLPLDARGVRGAVVLEKGRYEVAGRLRLAASGVVLRGAGPQADGTVIVATGTSRRSLIEVTGTGEVIEIDGSRTTVVDPYVPVGSRVVHVARAEGLGPGQRVIVRRPSTKEWIARLGMDTFPGWRPQTRLHWQPGSRDVEWERRITSVSGSAVTLDAPITTALDAEYGGATLARSEFPGRLAHVGVEQLRLVSAFDAARPLDEDHAWFAISLDKVEDAWVANVAAFHFASAAVNAGAATIRLTVQDVEARAPVSEVGGYRRRAFSTAGQLTLFNRCTSQGAIHDFVVGHAAAGPNVFLDSRGEEALGESGPIESWASGVLLDRVVIRGNAIRLGNRGLADQGVGWAAANSVVWNCEATDVEASDPPGAHNRAYGCRGVTTGDGIVYDPRALPFQDFYRGLPVRPRSLYAAQLAARLGADGVNALAPRPSIERTDDARVLGDADVAASRAARQGVAPAHTKPLRVEHGAFVIDGERAWTSRSNWAWYLGQMPPTLAKGFGAAITRFAPGRTGPGLTDDLEQVVAGMKPGAAFYQHYGLWYDRRRVDHNYYGSQEQRTGEVWAPFVESPWARSGQGKAWDGLSRFDLTRFNPWYFDRLDEFAGLADREGRVLFYAFYFQHWLLESPAHYVDFPWRPYNTIQDTGLPAEVPAADVFYDVSNPLRRDLHRRYIRKVLDTLGRHTNVVFGIDREYTGPLSFVQFWLDEIAAWEQATGRHVLIALEVPKDELDALLADPVRSPMVTALDVHGWVYRADGRLFASKGGVNKALREQRPDVATPEEWKALTKDIDVAALDQVDYRSGPNYQPLFDRLWASSPVMKYRAWREYRDAYPDLVVLTTVDTFPDVTAAVEAAIPRQARERTRATDLVRAPRDSAWAVARDGESYVVYDMSGGAVDLDLSASSGRFAVSWVDPATRSLTSSAPVAGGRRLTLAPPPALAGRACVAWLSRTGRGR